MIACSRPGRPLRTHTLALALAAIVGCSPPPDELDVAPLQLRATASDLPQLSNVCGTRGRLFGAGSTDEAGLILEEGAVGLSPVFLEDSLPPLSDCWQAATAEVFFVGGGVAVVRTPEGAWHVEDVASAIADTDVSLNAIVGVNADLIFAVGAADGEGIALVRLAGEWSRLELGDIVLPELVAADIGPSGVLYAVGANSALRWDGTRATLLGTPTAQLSSVAAGDNGVWAVSSDALVLELMGTQLTEVDRLESSLTTIVLSGQGDLWVAGERGYVARYLQLDSGSLASVPRTAETPDESEVIALEATRQALVALALGPVGTEIWSLQP